MKQFNLRKSLIFALIFSLSISACQKKVKPGKSIEQIRAESGVPVRVMTIGERGFEKDLSFFCKSYWYKGNNAASSIR